MWEKISRNRKSRVMLGIAALAVLGSGASYLYYHDPVSYPMPCIFHVLTGLYCPGCGAGRASFAILHGRFAEAFSYNPLMSLLLPFIGLYFAARSIDWIITGGNHIDRRISVKILLVILIIVLVYGVLRNIPVYPFTLLAPGGLGIY